jgi:hypothetical protein
MNPKEYLGQETKGILFSYGFYCPYFMEVLVCEK